MIVIMWHIPPILSQIPMTCNDFAVWLRKQNIDYNNCAIAAAFLTISMSEAFVVLLDVCRIVCPIISKRGELCLA